MRRSNPVALGLLLSGLAGQFLCSNLGSSLQGLAELLVVVHELVVEPGPQRGEELREPTRVQVQP